MCTLTIHQTINRLLLTMNRDEARTRAPELPPRVMQHPAKQMTWVGPLDGNAGGTWIGSNEHQVHACLLNQYGPTDADFVVNDGSRPSRGRIITDLMAHSSILAARYWLRREFDPNPFPPFLLVVAEPRSTLSVTWDRKELRFITHHAEWLMFSSSSWRTDEVLAYRQSKFEQWMEAGAPHIGRIPAFHLLQPEGLREWAPLMQREHSATRSITQIETNSTRRETEMRYWSISDLDRPELPPRTWQLPQRLDKDRNPTNHRRRNNGEPS